MLLVFCKFTKLRDFKWCQRSDVLKIRVERWLPKRLRKIGIIYYLVFLWYEYAEYIYSGSIRGVGDKPGNRVSVIGIVGVVRYYLYAGSITGERNGL